MRVAVDLTTVAKPRMGGISGYGRHLVSTCERVAGQVQPGIEWVVAIRQNRWLSRRYVEDLLPDAPRRLLFDAAAAVILKDVDVFHGIGVRLPATSVCAKVVTLHDMNVFEHPELSTPQWRAKRTHRIRQTLERADLAVALSRQGAEAIVEHVGFPAERIRVVPHGVDTSRFHPATTEQVEALRQRLGLGDRPYVVSLGAFGTRKNQAGLMQAFVAANLPAEWVLVLGGPRGTGADEARAHAARVGLPADQLVLPGFVADDDVPALLTGAAFYACPSLHEGFGLPLLEAQACGLPVLSSNRGGLPETVGDVGVLFDPTDPNEFRDAIARLATEDSLRDELSRLGIQRVAERFTWERAAADMLAVWSEAAAAH